VQNQKVTRRASCDISNRRSRRVEFSPGCFGVIECKIKKLPKRYCVTSNGRSREEFSPGVVRGHQVQNEKVTKRVSCDVSNGRSRRVESSPGGVPGSLSAKSKSYPKGIV
jgi:hypothetical protein